MSKLIELYLPKKDITKVAKALVNAGSHSRSGAIAQAKQEYKDSCKEGVKTCISELRFYPPKDKAKLIEEILDTMVDLL